MNRFTLLFILSASAWILLACSGSGPGKIQILPTDEPPGVGEKAEQGYAFSEPIIAALEAYKNDHGSYPEDLDQLAPDYLPVAPVAPDDLDYSYSSDGPTYSFSFHYRGPGLNTCTYESEAEEWDCSGAF
jgi:hypothetical protein